MRRSQVEVEVSQQPSVAIASMYPLFTYKRYPVGVCKISVGVEDFRLVYVE